MTCNQNKSWFLGIVAFVALFAGSSLFLSSDLGAQPSAIQFSSLSDADIDMILAVKAEMQAARTSTN